MSKITDSGQKSSGTLSRRAFLKFMGGALVFTPIADLLRFELAGYALASEDSPRFIEYHAVTPEFHTLKTEELPSLGYRLVSLSIYDFKDRHPQYAAVWLKRSGPVQRFVQEVDSDGFQAAFDAFAQVGFKPAIVAATTSRLGMDRFAAVFEETSNPIPLTRHNLVSGDIHNPATIQYWTQQAWLNRLRPTTLTVYGTWANPRFAAVWEPNPKVIAWNTDGLMETFAEHQEHLEAQITAWNRPVYVTVSPSVHYLSLFQDDQIGPWISRHGMDRADYEEQLADFVGQGYLPLTVQAGGFGSAVRYAALFTKQDRPITRRFTLRDSEDTPPGAIDSVMKTMMAANGIRQAALAVVHGTKLLFARGYTWAEPDYPLTTATTLFRVASCSKVLTALTVLRLVQEGRLRLADKIQDILQLTTPEGQPPIDDRFHQVTIQQALTLTSGLRYRWDQGPEVVSVFGAQLPATKLQIARYEVGQPGLMLRNPGEPDPNNILSNFGYLLVSLVIEQVGGTNGEPFAQLVRERVGLPLHATRIRDGADLVSEQQPGEARYHDDSLKLERSVMSHDQPLVPLQYGWFNLPALSGAGGLSVAAVDFARILAALNLRRNNPVLAPQWIDTMLRDFNGWDFPHGNGTPAGSYHRVKGGLLDGLQSTVNFTQGQFAYVVYWAKDDVRGVWYPEFPALQDVIHTTLDPRNRDRFPDFGMPTF